jgi:hypothetical protein
LRETEFIIVTFGLLTVAGVAVIWMAIENRRRIREMEHRERLAMIERGLVPSPEVDPEGFELGLARTRAPEGSVAARWRTAGVMMIGLGLALMFLIAFAGGEGRAGVGVGGAFVVLGFAFFVNGQMLDRGQADRRTWSSSVPARRPEPKDPPSSQPLG